MFSTYKWLGNVKGCSVVRVDEKVKVPDPCGISFGYNTEPHLWIGMMNYNAYILLAKALRVYEKYGNELVKKSSDILK